MQSVATHFSPTIRSVWVDNLSSRARMHQCHVVCQATSRVPTERQDPLLTLPLIHEVTEVLSSSESAPAPLWASWCGAAGGLWVGSATACSPSSGETEPIGLGEDGRTLLLRLYQCCVEERVADDIHGDRYVRHTSRASSLEELSREMVAGAAHAFAANASMDWEVEELKFEQPGLCIFDGGSFSFGPQELMCSTAALPFDGEVGHETEGFEKASASFVGEEFDEDEGDLAEESEMWSRVTEAEIPPPAGSTSVIEAGLQWGGEERVRVSLTLNAVPSPIEENARMSFLDLTLLRIVVSRETWEGAPGRYTSAAQGERERIAQESSSLMHLKPRALYGFWNVFEVSSTTVEDVDTRTGLPAAISVYRASEVQWLVRDNQESTEMEGGALWLPHNVVLQVTQSSDEINIEVLWSPQEGVVVGMLRSYDSQGILREVISSTRIRAK